MPPLDLLLTHATLPDGSRAHVGIAAGAIACIQPADLLSDTSALSAAATLDLAGDLLCPGLIDGHIHLDKTFLGAGWVPHMPGGTVRERIAAEKQVFKQLTVPVEARAAALADLALSHGSTTLRTHVDIDPDVGLSKLHAVLAVKEQYRDRLTIQIVAFPQSGVISCPGTLALLDAAIQEGADLVGGLDPAGIDSDIAGQLDGLFAIAERRGVGIDIHLHDPDHLGVYELGQIAERTQALGLGGRVAVSHAYALGMVPHAVMVATADRLAHAGVAIMTNAPGTHGFPPVTALRAAGVTVFAGSDNIRDAWWPFGNGDMLDRAAIIAYRSGFYTDAELCSAFELTTTSAAQALGLGLYGLVVGAPADLVVMDVQSIPEAVVARPVRKWVFKAGQPVVQPVMQQG